MVSRTETPVLRKGAEGASRSAPIVYANAVSAAALASGEDARALLATRLGVSTLVARGTCPESEAGMVAAARRARDGLPRPGPVAWGHAVGG